MASTPRTTSATTRAAKSTRPRAAKAAATAKANTAQATAKPAAAAPKAVRSANSSPLANIIAQAKDSVATIRSFDAAKTMNELKDLKPADAVKKFGKAVADLQNKAVFEAPSATAVRAHILTNVKNSQELTLDATKGLVETATRFAPKATKPFAHKVRKAALTNVEFAHDLYAAQVEFTTKLAKTLVASA